MRGKYYEQPNVCRVRNRRKQNGWYGSYALDDSKCIGWDIYVFWDELEVVVGRKVDLVPIKFVPEKYYEFMVKPSKDFYHAA